MRRKNSVSEGYVGRYTAKDEKWKRRLARRPPELAGQLPILTRYLGR